MTQRERALLEVIRRSERFIRDYAKWTGNNAAKRLARDIEQLLTAQLPPPPPEVVGEFMTADGPIRVSSDMEPEDMWRVLKAIVPYACPHPRKDEP